ITGTLETINSVEALIRTDCNGIMGPGGHCWDVPNGFNTNFTVRMTSGTTSGKDRTLNYLGLILPDSIGNPVKVILEQTLGYQDAVTKERVIEIFDQRLQRNYRITRGK
ncbi:MAG: hypothetical protein WCP89_03205, partial [archaeon]